MGMNVNSTGNEPGSMFVFALAQAPAEDGLKASVNNAGQKKNGFNISGNDLKVADPLAEKRRKAQSQALKLVKDVWENDKEVEAEKDKRRQDIKEQMQELSEMKDHLKQAQESHDALKQEYGIADGSQEQKDLELLEKREEYCSSGKLAELTEEEQARLEELDSAPLTEYQERSLGLKRSELNWKREISKVEERIKYDNQDIFTIEQEELKSHAMEDAKKQGDKILEAANKEIVGMAFEEAKENVEELQEEEKEKQDKAKEEQKEKEERLEEQEEKRAIERAFIEGTKEAAQEAQRKVREHQDTDVDMEDVYDPADMLKKQAAVNKSLDDMKDKMQLVEADLKGLKVDEEV